MKLKLFLLLFLLFATTKAKAYSDFYCGDYGFCFYDAEPPETATEVYVNAYYGDDVNVTIPSFATYTKEGKTYKYAVTQVNAVFCYNEKIESAIVPANIRRIYGTFGWCTNLKSVQLPETLQELGVSYVGLATPGAFSGCKNLRSITIPNSVTKIGRYSFESCENLSDIVISPSVKWIGDAAFQRCSSLQSIILPGRLEHLGGWAFCSTAINSIIIPENLNSIGANAFSSNENLEEVIWLPRDCELNEQPESGRPTYEDHNAPFIGCPNLTSFLFGTNVHIIPRLLCHGLDNVTDIVLPNSVKVIGNRSFYYMGNLKNVAFGNNLQIIESNAFEGCSKLKNITFPHSLETIGDQAFWFSGLETVEFGESLTNIGGAAFSSTKIKTIELPDGFKNLGEGAFYNCYNLTDITLGKSVSFIGDCNFIGCGNMKNIYSKILNPNNVTLDGSFVFADIPMDICTLHVPRGTVAVYRGCDQWKEFLNIVEDVDISGDLNGDGIVDVSDMNIIIDTVLGKQEQDLSVADLNNDGIVDVSDVSALIDIVLGKN